MVSVIETKTISETNRLLNAAAVVVGRYLGITRVTTKRRNDIDGGRIQMKIKQLRRDMSILQRKTSGDFSRKDITQQLERKYNLSKKGYQVVLEELKQRLKAQAAKLKRYEDRNTQYRQNRMFESNQRRLFEELGGIERVNDTTPDAEESWAFWNRI